MFNSPHKLLAIEIDDLVRDPIIMKRFLDKMREYNCMLETYTNAISKMIEERKHNWQNIQDNKRLRDKDAGQPGLGWAWENTSVGKCDKQGVYYTDPLDSGWFPPSKIKVSSHPIPWIYGNDGQMSVEHFLLAEYTLLAIFHDCMLFGKRPLIITEEIAKECKWIGAFRSFYPSGDLQSIADKFLPIYEEHIPVALKDIQQDIKTYLDSGAKIPEEFSDANKARKKKRPTAMEMKNRNKAIAMDAAKFEAKHDCLPTVGDIMQITGFARQQVYTTDAYKEGKIAKQSAKLTGEATGSIVRESELYGNNSIQHSRANRRSKADQAEHDALIDAQAKDDKSRHTL